MSRRKGVIYDSDEDAGIDVEPDYGKQEASKDKAASGDGETKSRGPVVEEDEDFVEIVDSAEPSSDEESEAEVPPPLVLTRAGAKQADSKPLRPYQEEIVRKVLVLCKKHDNGPTTGTTAPGPSPSSDQQPRISTALLYLPTGGGKTRVATALASRFLATRGSKAKVWFVVNRTALVTQAGEAFAEAGLSVGYIKAGIKEDASKQIQVVSIQTLGRRYLPSVGKDKDHEKDKGKGAKSKGEGSKDRKDKETSPTIPSSLRPSLVISDEAHAAVSSSYLQLFLSLGILSSPSPSPASGSSPPPAPPSPSRPPFLLGLTATPIRLSKEEQLSSVFRCLIRGPSVSALIGQGVLVPPVFFDVAFSPDDDKDDGKAAKGSQQPTIVESFKKQSSSGGRKKGDDDEDFDEGDEGEADVKPSPELTYTYRKWKSKAYGRPTIVFAADVSHSQALVRLFNQKGIPSAHIDSGTPEAERLNCFRRLAEAKGGWDKEGQKKRKKGRKAAKERGEDSSGTFSSSSSANPDSPLLILSSVGVLSEGFDCPSVSCVMLLRPTHSKALFIQQLGRGLRCSPATGKKDCIVLDGAGNALRHGPVTGSVLEDDEWREGDDDYDGDHDEEDDSDGDGTSGSKKKRKDKGERELLLLEDDDEEQSEAQRQRQKAGAGAGASAGSRRGSVASVSSVSSLGDLADLLSSKAKLSSSSSPGADTDEEAEDDDDGLGGLTSALGSMSIKKKKKDEGAARVKPGEGNSDAAKKLALSEPSKGGEKAKKGGGTIKIFLSTATSSAANKKAGSNKGPNPGTFNAAALGIFRPKAWTCQVASCGTINPIGSRSCSNCAAVKPLGKQEYDHQKMMQQAKEKEKAAANKTAAAASAATSRAQATAASVGAVPLRAPAFVGSSSFSGFTAAGPRPSGPVGLLPRDLLTGPGLIKGVGVGFVSSSSSSLSSGVGPRPFAGPFRPAAPAVAAPNAVLPTASSSSAPDSAAPATAQVVPAAAPAPVAAPFVVGGGAAKAIASLSAAAAAAAAGNSRSGVQPRPVLAPLTNQQTQAFVSTGPAASVPAAVASGSVLRSRSGSEEGEDATSLFLDDNAPSAAAVAFKRAVPPPAVATAAAAVALPLPLPLPSSSSSSSSRPASVSTTGGAPLSRTNSTSSITSTGSFGGGFAGAAGGPNPSPNPAFIEALQRHRLPYFNPSTMARNNWESGFLTNIASLIMQPSFRQLSEKQTDILMGIVRRYPAAGAAPTAATATASRGPSPSLGPCFVGAPASYAPAPALARPAASSSGLPS